MERYELRVSCIFLDSTLSEANDHDITKQLRGKEEGKFIKILYFSLQNTILRIVKKYVRPI